MLALLPPESRNSYLGTIVNDSWKSQGEAATSLINILPNNVDRINATAHLTGLWLASDPAGAGKWISSLQMGAERDAGLRVLIDNVEASDPVAASQWKTMLVQKTK